MEPLEGILTTHSFDFKSTVVGQNPMCIKNPHGIGTYDAMVESPVDLAGGVANL